MRILKLPPERWREYREIRLDALKTDPKAFGSTHEKTSQLADDVWIERLETAQRERTKTILFAEEDGTLLGMVGAHPDQETGVVNVISMFVRPQHRGTGIAGMLLRSVLEEVNQAEVHLVVNESQVAAIRLYERFGFVTIANTSLTRADGSEYVQLWMSLRRASF